MIINQMSTHKNLNKTNQLIQNQIKQKKQIINTRFIDSTDYIFANVYDYKFLSWSEYFPDKLVKLRKLITNKEWNKFFDIIESKPYFKNIEDALSMLIQNKATILPNPELVFNTLNVLSPKQIRVLFLGQDPYANINSIHTKNGLVNIPEAMGFCFSVPLNAPKPPSLRNIYNNLLKYKQIDKIPEGGCLGGWVAQGCFMINSSLTTLHGQFNIHKDLWKEFSNDLLKYIDENCNSLVVCSWGGDAHKICQVLNPLKHHIITSSHPSPLACTKSLNGNGYGKNIKQSVTYPAFCDLDHFGTINKYLDSPIIWDVIDLIK